MENTLSQHDIEIQANLKSWNERPLLRQIYKDFHELIAKETTSLVAGYTVELGSGIGNIKEIIPHCIRTDLFPNPWIDQTESAYKLSFEDNSASNIILFDVFHHLRYPGTALEECRRVLAPGGRVIIFDPCMSCLGLLVYGLLHHEPIALRDTITWKAPFGWSFEMDTYYAAQGNAYRVFWDSRFAHLYNAWNLKTRRRYSALSYVACGGYSKPQLYPKRAYGFMKQVDGIADLVPALFATRLLVTLEKPL